MSSHDINAAGAAYLGSLHDVRLGGRPVSGSSQRAIAHLRRTEMGFVFQGFHLMDELTAIENVELPGYLPQRDPECVRGGLR